MAFAYVVEPNSNIPDIYETYGFTYKPSKSYMGYFKNTRYSYNNASGYFEENAAGDFDGNFMNWATMHRLDISRIILTGGFYNSTRGCFEVINTNYISGGGDNDYTNHDVYGHSRAISTYNNTTPLQGYIVQVPNTQYFRIYDKDPNEKNSGAVAISGNYNLYIKNEHPDTTGVLDDFANKARFALARYYVIDENNDGVHDSPNNAHKGAKMLVHMGENTVLRIKEEINRIWPSAVAAPMAEAIFTVAGYVMQPSEDTSLEGPRYEDDSFSTNTTDDPYYFSKYGYDVSCTQQSIILISPGESAFGDSVPIGDNKVISPLPAYPNDYGVVKNGKYYIQDTAHWMHTSDLRSDLNGTQDIDLYVVRAFGINATDLVLQDAAMFGGFTDRNGNNLPVTYYYDKNKIARVDFETTEYDSIYDNDTLPDNYFTADGEDTGEGLKKAITAAFEAATRRVTSGTAAAVTSQTRSGDGAVYQALFFPPTSSDGVQPIAPPWTGQVHAMLVDSNGTIREDTNANHRLDSGDKAIAFSGEQILRYYVGNSTIENLDNIQDINFLWSSTPLLNSMTETHSKLQRSYGDTVNKRYIFTFADANNDGLVTDSTEVQDFTSLVCSLSTNNFCNFLTLYEDTSGAIGTPAGDVFSSTDLPALAKRQVDFIRGADVGNATFGAYTDIARSRGLNATVTNWRLGDVVYSSPTIVGAPSENYHTLYQDSSYRDFYNKYRHRRQILYVGANDGMLHAFNGGFYNSTIRGFDLSYNGASAYPLGMELWAYVPYNQLPHLRWLMNPDYGGSLHVPYMDLKPRVFDARIFIDSSGNSQDPAIYPNGWGTLLVAGMRFGGGEIEVDIDTSKDGTEKRTMSSAYVILDITNPESPPKLLGEIRMPRQGFTTCYPTVMPMATQDASNPSLPAQNSWFLVFGSGPADANGKAQATGGTDYRKPAVSDQAGQVYILDLNALAEGTSTRELRTLSSDGNFYGSRGAVTAPHDPFTTTEAGSFIGDPIAVDLDIGAYPTTNSFRTDSVYFGTVSGDSTTPGGTMRRITTGNVMPTASGAPSWISNTLIDVGLPVTSAPSAAVDETNRLWIYFGAGRFYNREDIAQTKNMSFFGIKEPVATNSSGRYYTWNTVNTSDLYNSTQITLKSACAEDVFTKDCVDAIKTTSTGNYTMSWDTLLSDVANSTGGWRQDFSDEGWERVLGQAAILGGAVLFTTYIPDTDICEPEGVSRLYGLYYKTGTAYYDPILGVLGDTISTFVGLGKGLAITPSLHVGDKGVTAYIQTSSGAIETIELETPLNVKSGALFWRKRTN
jgi:type IV pilus assembly protein PilY1